MSIQQFLVAVKAEKLSEGDAKWFPRWVDRYAQWTSQKGADKIVIRTESLIELLRQLRDSGKKAFMRLQGIRFALSAMICVHLRFEIVLVSACAGMTGCCGVPGS
ncbi:MAG: hypothetical protein JNM43_04790 [Planctomycetaceae bacterium]|nr:hypothetical protein [Planctomycetaceae bacterium]